MSPDTPDQNPADRPTLDSLTDIRPELLSPSARARRDAVRTRVAAASRRRRARRITLQSAAVLAPVIAVVGFAALGGDAPATPGTETVPAVTLHAPPGLPEIVKAPAQTAKSAPESFESPLAAAPLVRYVTDDTSVLDRLSIEKPPAVVQRLSDQDVLTELRAAGIHAGLVHTEHRARLAVYTTTPEPPTQQVH